MARAEPLLALAKSKGFDCVGTWRVYRNHTADYAIEIYGAYAAGPGTELLEAAPSKRLAQRRLRAALNALPAKKRRAR